jgi:nitrogen fixation-related uncharacterized protein
MRSLNITRQQVKWALITLGIVAVGIALLICWGIYLMQYDDRGLQHEFTFLQSISKTRKPR